MTEVRVIEKLPTEVQALLRSTVNIYSYSQCITELVLNSLDSNATSIAVRVNLTNHYIQVIDNGDGISKADMESVGIRYMTSKCKSLLDLNNGLNKFGFRGEALASIIAMSEKVCIVSRCKNTQETHGKDFMKGLKSEIYDTNFRPSNGTTITITNFMYNLGVRQKRVDGVLDMEEIRSAMESISLIHYHVSMSLRDNSNSRLVLKSHKHDSVKNAFMFLMDEKVGSTLRQITIAKDEYSMEVHIARKGHFSKKLQFVYINKRLVMNSAIQRLFNNLLLKKSYSMREENKKTLNDDNVKSLKNNKSTSLQQNVEAKKFPVFIVNLCCPYSSYDVTFLPDKSLVEFKKWDKVSKLIEVLIGEIIVLELGMDQNKSEKVEHDSSNEKDVHQPVLNKADLKNLVENAFKNAPDKFGTSQLQNAIKGAPAKRKRKLLEKSTVKNIEKAITIKENINDVSKNNKSEGVIDEDDEESYLIKRRNKKLRQQKSNFVQNNIKIKKGFLGVNKNQTERITPGMSCNTQNCNFINEGSFFVRRSEISSLSEGIEFPPESDSISTFLNPKYNCKSAVKRFDEIRFQLNKLENEMKTHSFQHKIYGKSSVFKSNIEDNLTCKHSSLGNSLEDGILAKYNLFKKPSLKIIKNNSKRIKNCQKMKKVNERMSHSRNPIIHRTNIKEYTVAISKSKYLKNNHFKRKSTFDLIKTIDQNFSSRNLNDIFLQNTTKTYFNSIKTFMTESSIPVSFDSHKNYFRCNKVISQEILQMKNNCFKEKKDCYVQTDMKLNDFQALEWVQTEQSKSWNNDQINKLNEQKFDTGNKLISDISLFNHTSKRHEKLDDFKRKKNKIVLNSESNETENENIYIGDSDGEYLQMNFSTNSMQIFNHKLNITNQYQPIRKDCCDVTIEFLSNNSCTNSVPVNSKHNRNAERLLDLHVNNSVPKECWNNSNKLNRNTLHEHNNSQSVSTNVIDRLPLFLSEQVHNTNKKHGIINNFNDSKESFNNYVRNTQLAVNKNDNFDYLNKQEQTKNNQTFHDNILQLSDTTRNLTKNNFSGTTLESCFENSIDKVKTNIDTFKFSSGSNFLVVDDKNEEMKGIPQSNIQIDDEIITTDTNPGFMDISRNALCLQCKSTSKKYSSKQNQDVGIGPEAMSNINHWDLKKDPHGNVIYLNDKTGMTLYENPNISVDNSYRVFKRPCFIPKGMSPILNLPDNEHINENTIQNILSKQSDEDNELSKIKWIKPYSDPGVYEDFIHNRNKNSSAFQPALTNSSIYHNTKSVASLKSIVIDRAVLKSLKVINQVDKKFIVTVADMTEKGSKILVLFDQHAVDERVRLESLLKEYRDKNKKWKSVKPLRQMKIELLSSEIMYMIKHKRSFENFGLIFTCLDECKINIKSFPACFEAKHLGMDDTSLNSLIVQFIKEEIEVLKTTRGNASLIPGVIYRTISSEACNGAIKFGVTLTAEKCESMMTSLEKCHVPFQCAHGRPVMSVLADLNDFQQHKIPKPNLRNLTRHCK